MKTRFITALFFCILVIALSVPASAGDCQISLKEEYGQAVIHVNNAQDLGAFELELSFDPKALTVNGIEKGVLMEESKRQFSQMGPKIDSGTLKFGFFSFGSDPGITGNGVLCRIISKGDSESLKIKKLVATDSKGNKVSCKF